jgi:hypothetical protein
MFSAEASICPSGRSRGHQKRETNKHNKLTATISSARLCIRVKRFLDTETRSEELENFRLHHASLMKPT